MRGSRIQRSLSRGRRRVSLPSMLTAVKNASRRSAFMTTLKLWYGRT
jgi:hypothetical protein